MSADKDAPLAQAIQRAVQPKLMENGWVADESDNELSEYITLMVMNGKTQEQVVSEVGTELLGVGEDDPAVAELSRWLFQQIPLIRAQLNGGGEAAVPQQGDEMMGGATSEAQQIQNGAPQPIPAVQDAQMDDATAPEEMYVRPNMNMARSMHGQYAAYSGMPYFFHPYPYHHALTHNLSPSGPKAMRNGSVPTSGRGRDKRMLGQLNRQLDRSSDDPLSRIKGAAGGQSGRINSHAGRNAPRGPRGGNVANGVQRMMNGRQPPNTPQMMQQGAQGGLTPQQQMQFLQMMESQANIMAQMFNGQMPNQQGAGFSQARGAKLPRGGRGGGRGGAQDGNRQHIHNGGMNASDSASMDVDTTMEDGTTVTKRKDPFDTMCKFNDKCTVATCPFAHQGPAAAPGTAVDLTDRCSYGAACENKKCAGKHPSPGQRKQHLKDVVDCKFYPNCANPNCPFRHPDMPACRNGADCTAPGCKFVHSKIMCRYNPCLNPGCVFKHAEGQKRGKFEDKVWQAESGEGTGEGFDREAAMKEEAASKTGRFQSLKEGEGMAEELILPGRTTPERSVEEGVVT